MDMLLGSHKSTGATLKPPAGQADAHAAVKTRQELTVTSRAGKAGRQPAAFSLQQRVRRTELWMCPGQRYSTYPDN